MASVRQDVNRKWLTLIDGNEDEASVSASKTHPDASPSIRQGEILIEGEFIELDDQLWFDKNVRILITSEFLYLTEKGSKHKIKNQAHVLQPEATKRVSKFRRSEIKTEIIEGCLYTFKAKWCKDSRWKKYRLCGQVNDFEWQKWMASFQLGSSSIESRSEMLEIPPMALPESGANTDMSSSEDDEEEELDTEELSLPKCLPLCVDRTMSMLSMTMLNPSNVRKLAMSNLQKDNSSLKRASLGTIGSENEDVFDDLGAGSLLKSYSHPRLSYTKPFCTFSLMNVSELNNVNIDDDLKIRKEVMESGCLDPTIVQQIKSKSFERHRRVNKFPQNVTAAELPLQNRIEYLRAHPSNLNFVRRHLWDEKTLAVPSSCHNRRLSLSLALNSDANRIPQSTESAYGVSSVKRPLLRTESSPVRPALLSGIKSTGTPNKRTPVARRLNFKDDMVIDEHGSDQKPQKAKVRRFWTILHKKRTRNHPSLPDMPFSPAKEYSDEFESSPSRLQRGRSFSAGMGRSRRPEEINYNKELRRNKASYKSTFISPLPARQDSVNDSPFSRKWSSPGSSGKPIPLKP